MRTLIVSSSLNPRSRSQRLARLALEWLETQEHSVDLLDLAACPLPQFDDASIYASPAYQDCVERVRSAQALILASPVYNWSVCAELKKFIEAVGSTDSTRPSPFFDKLVSLLFAAGLPHSYMVLGTVALPLMLDFRCVINPNQAYLHNQHWSPEEELTPAGRSRLERMLTTHLDLSRRLEGYRHTDAWQV